MRVNGPSHCRHFDESSLTFFLLQYSSTAFLTIYLGALCMSASSRVGERTHQPENIAYASSSKVYVKTDAQKLHS
jgi:hypothetical protein